MPDPNHIWLKEEKLVFALPCKNANTSVKLAILKHLGKSFPLPNQPPQYGVHQADLFTYIDLKDTPDDCKVIGVMREPWDRLQSQYMFARNGKVDFAYWIRDVAHRPDYEVDQHVRSQFWDLTVEGKFYPHLVLYVDDLANDWAAFEHLVHWDAVGISHANTLEENGIVRWKPGDLSDESRKAIISRYGHDYFLYRAVQHLKASRVWGSVSAIKEWVEQGELSAMDTDGVH